MFRLNDPILIPHRDFLRSFSWDQPISGSSSLTSWHLGPCVMHGAALVHKRSPVPAEDSGNTQPSVLRKFPRNYQTGGYCHHTPGHQTGSVSAPASPHLGWCHLTPLTSKCSQYSNCTPVKSLISNKVFSEKKNVNVKFFCYIFNEIFKELCKWWHLVTECSQYSTGIIKY